VRRYGYVGPPEIRDQAHAEIGRLCPRDQQELASSPLLGSADRAELTFIVDVRNRLWLSDRRTEHVACARGGEVLGAGEIILLRSGDEIRVAEITNQSTGYCPEPACWEAVRTALVMAGLVPPSEWTHAFDFRRCDSCRTINILKEEYPECGCGADLPSAWNCDP